MTKKKGFFPTGVMEKPYQVGSVNSLCQIFEIIWLSPSGRRAKPSSAEC